ARCEPRQRWTPPPKAMWRLTSRSKRTSSAASKYCSSVLAEPSSAITWSPSFTGQAATSLSSSAARTMPITGVSQRRIPSTADGGVAVGLPVEAHLVGVLGVLLVGVGRAEQGDHVVTLRHRAAGDLAVLQRGPLDAHHRGLPAQHLLVRRRDQVGVLDDLASV